MRSSKHENELLFWKFTLLNANKQTNKQKIYYFNDIQAPGLHTIQYCNVHKTEDKMVATINATKTIYIGDFVHHMGRWLIRKTLNRVKTTFTGAHDLNGEIS